MPKRIQRLRIKGWRMSEGAIYVGRPSKWGNPYTASSAMETGYKDGHKMAVWAFRQWLAGTPAWGDERDERRTVILARLAELRGRDLCCWCPLIDARGNPFPCHADILLSLANEGAA
jgi:Domain of unknown function (DUF4326)